MPKSPENRPAVAVGSLTPAQSFLARATYHRLEAVGKMGDPRAWIREMSAQAIALFPELSDDDRAIMIMAVGDALLASLRRR